MNTSEKMLIALCIIETAIILVICWSYIINNLIKEDTFISDFDPKIGDVVILKSGSPPMTIVKIEKEHIATSYFSNKKYNALVTKKDALLLKT